MLHRGPTQWCFWQNDVINLSWFAFNPYTGNRRGNYHRGVFFCKLSPSYQRSVTVVFVSFHWIIWASDASGAIIISAFRFSLRSIKWNFVSRKNRVYRGRHEQLWSTHSTFRNVIVLNFIRCKVVYNSVGNHVRAFSTWRTQTGSSNISPSMALFRTA